MMNFNLKDSINHCLELINVNTPIALWTYQKDLTFSDEQLTDFQPLGDVLEVFDLKKHITNDMISLGEPMILENSFGMMLILCFSRKGSRMIAAGPAYAGLQDARDLRRRMETFGLSVARINTILKNLPDLPVISYIQFVQIALMLHYCLNHEKLDPDRVRFFATVSDHETKEDTSPRDINEHKGIWEAEQKFVSMIEHGSLNTLSMPRQLSVLSNGMRNQSEDSLREAKNNFIMMLTIVSRAAIRGGLSPDIAYTLNDQYGAMIEKQRSLADVSSLCEKMLTDYVMRLRRKKLQAGVSFRVQDACDWILMHLEEDLSIRQIADREGYTPYYFSRLFKKETGASVSNWIKTQRIQRAEELLKNTNLSIDEINEKLHFGSREYFSSSFHKETGMSPTEFRKQKEKSSRT